MTEIETEYGLVSITISWAFGKGERSPFMILKRSVTPVLELQMARTYTRLKLREEGMSPEALAGRLAREDP